MVNSDRQGESPGRVAEKTVAGTSARYRHVEIPSALTVKQLADILKVTPVDAMKRLIRRGVMANVNQVIDFDIAAAVASDFGYEARPEPVSARRAGRLTEDRKKRRLQEAQEAGGLVPRPPVVTIMGHVNHGKTRLLDAIRQTNVMDQEAGGITQHIGAYQVEVDGHRITFLDTPGHEAFTAMRARGAQVTDITILVVAADDGIMPQTLEAIDHARAAGVPIVVAINKIDRPDANPQRVKQQLADAGLVAEDWGGDTVCVEISAREKIGIDDLLENLMVVAEMEELKADPTRPAQGVVIEAEMDRSRGALGRVLVHSGTLRVGDTVVVGETWGRVKAMFTEASKRVKRAGPSTPVEILGLSEVPQVGDVLAVVSDERQAQAVIDRHRADRERERATARAVNLSNVYEQLTSGRVKDLNIVLKADVQGSIEPIRTSLEQLSEGDIRVRVIHSATGNVTESDVMLAIASKAVVIGFNTGVETGARRLADLEGVSIRGYDVIYNVLDDVSKALKGMLEPTYVEVIDGRAEVRAVFSLGRRGKAVGAYVTEGRIVRGAPVRVLRDGKVLSESVVSSLRRFKDDVREVAAGYECGVGIRDFNDFQEGDILEAFRKEEAA